MLSPEWRQRSEGRVARPWLRAYQDRSTGAATGATRAASRAALPAAEAEHVADHLGDREYQLVLRAVQRFPRRLDEAARELGVSRTTLWRRMRKYDIKLPGATDEVEG